MQSLLVCHKQKLIRLDFLAFNRFIIQWENHPPLIIAQRICHSVSLQTFKLTSPLHTSRFQDNCYIRIWQCLLCSVKIVHVEQNYSKMYWLSLDNIVIVFSFIIKKFVVYPKMHFPLYFSIFTTFPKTLIYSNYFFLKLTNLRNYNVFLFRLINWYSSMIFVLTVWSLNNHGRCFCMKSKHDGRFLSVRRPLERCV